MVDISGWIFVAWAGGSKRIGIEGVFKMSDSFEKWGLFDLSICSIHAPICYFTRSVIADLRSIEQFHASVEVTG